MDRNLQLPTFGRAPDKYDPAYFYDMVRMLNNMTTMLTAPGVGRQSTLVITNMPSGSDYNLELGALFQVNGIVRVSVANIPLPLGVSSTTSVGVVTVTTV